MTDRPITFRASMVRALLDGRTTQHRVPLKPQPGVVSFIDGVVVLCCEDGYAVAGQTKPQPMPYAVGDRLWCREVWGLGVSDHGNCPRYRATMDYRCGDKIRSHHEGPFTWRSPVTMPRWASRLTLIVTDVRVQRLQDISRGDAMDEGCPFQNMADGDDPREWFRAIWNSLHGPDAWDRNPWVAALTFTTHHQNIDQMEPPND